MAGYTYRGTPARARAAEELMRSRGIDDVRQDIQRSRKVVEATVAEYQKAAKNGDVFEVVREAPKPARRAPRKNTLKVAASSAVKVLEENPGEWFRVAKRPTKSKAYSYTATLRSVTEETLQTRIVDEDGEFIVFARTKTEGKK